MPIRTSEDGPDLPQSDEAVTAPRVGVEEADLPKLDPPEWGKVEKRIDPPIPCFIRDQRGGLHRAQIIGMECDAGRAAPASYVCLSCRHPFDDPTQGAQVAAAVKCPHCKKKGVEIIPAQRQSATYGVKGGPGVTVYLVQQVETQSEMRVDDPEKPGEKKTVVVHGPIPQEQRGTATLTADRIRLP